MKLVKKHSNTQRKKSKIKKSNTQRRKLKKSKSIKRKKGIINKTAGSVEWYGDNWRGVSGPQYNQIEAEILNLLGARPNYKAKEKRQSRFDLFAFWNVINPSYKHNLEFSLMTYLNRLNIKDLEQLLVLLNDTIELRHNLDRNMQKSGKTSIKSQQDHEKFRLLLENMVPVVKNLLVERKKTHRESLKQQLAEQQLPRQQLSEQQIPGQELSEQQIAENNQTISLKSELPISITDNPTIFSTPSISNLSDIEKKKRGIEKKLRQIQEIQEKRMHGHKLTSPEIKKIESEFTLRKQLNSLNPDDEEELLNELIKRQSNKLKI